MAEFQTGYWHALDKQAARASDVPTTQIGIPTHPAKDQLQGLKSRIMVGAQNVELGFMGRGKGNLQGGNTTPGMFGKDERQAMKELAKVNKVNISSIHGSSNVMGFAGWDHRSGFDDSMRQNNVNEAKRAIEFAGDTTEGGAIVIHTGEFPRSIYEIKDEKYLGKFKEYPDEEKRASLYIVDKFTGRMIEGIRKDQEISVANIDPIRGTIQTDPKTGQPKTVTRDFNWFVERSKENEKAGKTGKNIHPAFLMYKAILDDDIRLNTAWANLHGKQYEENLTNYEREKRGREELAKGDLKKVGGQLKQIDQKLIKDKIRMDYDRDVALSHQLRANQARQRLDRAVPLEEYGLQKTADSVSELGIYAMDTTKDKKLKKPLFVAPENIMIETGYGSHPEELKQVVLKSREAMSKKLVENKGMSKGRANQLASQHIKATFDVGYANTWKKYFQGDDKEFKKWMGDKTKDLLKKGVMGHVHMSDNFGYEGEHGTLGQGNVPIKEFASELKKRGFKGTMIAEPAHNDYRALLGAWRALESPMYKIDSTSRTWTDVEHGYFGQTVSPNYITQTYLPMMGTKAGDPSSWSETPME